MGKLPSVRTNYADQTDTKRKQEVAFVKDFGPLTVAEEEARGGYNNTTQPTGRGEANKQTKGTGAVADDDGSEEG